MPAMPTLIRVYWDPDRERPSPCEAAIGADGRIYARRPGTREWWRVSDEPAPGTTWHTPDRMILDHETIAQLQHAEIDQS